MQQYRYTTQPDGLWGNDDYGTLSSWFVLSALGLYPEVRCVGVLMALLRVLIFCFCDILPSIRSAVLKPVCGHSSSLPQCHGVPHRRRGRVDHADTGSQHSGPEQQCARDSCREHPCQWPATVPTSCFPRWCVLAVWKTSVCCRNGRVVIN